MSNVKSGAAARLQYPLTKDERGPEGGLDTFSSGRCLISVSVAQSQRCAVLGRPASGQINGNNGGHDER